MDIMEEHQHQDDEQDISNNDNEYFDATYDRFSSFVKNLMIEARFDADDRQINSAIFLYCKNLVLLALAEKLYEMKKISSSNLTEEETNNLNWLKSNADSFSADIEQMRKSEQLLSEQEGFISKLMRQESNQAPNTKENNDSCIVSLFKLLSTETKNLIEEKSRLELCTKVNPQTHKIKNIVPYEELQIDDSLTKKILVTDKHTMYRVATSDGYMTLKVLNSKTPPAKDVENLVKELTIADELEHHVFVKTYARTMYRNRHALLLEWIDGYSLGKGDTKSFNLLDFLSIAKDLVSALVELQRKDNFDVNLSSNNIIIMSDEKETCPSAKIILCASSISDNRKKNYIPKNNLIAMDLLHLAPERSGLLDRRIDLRSDFYSLGIIFYKLLSGRYPFKNENILKLIYLHLLQDPPPITNIPEAISDMVKKLLEKNPDDRYQSAKGILHDLYLVASEYNSDKSLKSVVLFQHDISETFFLPQKIYGRSNEYSKLLSVFTNAASNMFKTLFIKGSAGCGKSILVSELYRPCSEKGGIFLMGSCYKLKPYSVFIEAIDNFCNNLLLEDYVTLANYRTIIQNAVGEEGKILTDIIPNLQLIIGIQPSISYAFGNQAKHRSDYVLIKFIKALFSFNRPLILILDDLQNIDSDSLDILLSLTKGSNKSLMIVGVYRDDEVNDSHPLVSLMKEMENLNVDITEISLESIDHESVNELISDSLHVSPLETYDLTAIVHKKTKGNPFFVNQVLNSFVEQKVIIFCNQKQKWTWDVSTLDEKNDIAENVSELLKQKLLSLDKKTLEALTIASYLGRSFSYSTLKQLLNYSKGIEDALDKGIISKGINNMYRFVHVQIKEVVIDLLPKDDRKKLHLYIGKKLWDLITNKNLDEDLILVAHLLKYTIDLVTDPKERLKMAKLFMETGAQSMKLNSFGRASHHFQTGIKLLSTDTWEKEYNISLKMFNQAAVAAYSNQKHSDMIALLNIISANATSALHLVQSNVIKVRYHNDKRKYAKAIEQGLAILDKIGERELCMKARSNSEDSSVINSQIQETKAMVNDILKRSLSVIQENEDETSNAVMLILSNMMTSSYQSSPKLLLLITCRMIHITFQHGISIHSSLPLCQFGVILSNRGDNLGIKVGNYALLLFQKMRSKELFPYVHGCYYCCLHPFNASVHLCYVPLLNGYRVGLETGNIDVSTLCAVGYCLIGFHSGKNLESLEKDTEELDKCLLLKPLALFSIRQAIKHLRSEDEVEGKNLAELSGETFVGYKCFDENVAPVDVAKSSGQCFFIAYLFHDYPLALRFIERSRPFTNLIAQNYQYSIYLFYNGLVSLAVARSLIKEAEKDKLVLKAGESISKLKRMAQLAPDNFLNKIHLIEAEMQFALGDFSKTLKHYEEAISLSKKHGFVHEEALSHERTAIFLLNQNKVDDACEHLLQSYDQYEAWGATSKTKHLVHCYPFIADKIKQFKCKQKHPVITDGQLEVNSLASVSLITSGSFCTFNSSYLQQKRVRFS